MQWTNHRTYMRRREEELTLNLVKNPELSPQLRADLINNARMGQLSTDPDVQDPSYQPEPLESAEEIRRMF